MPYSQDDLKRGKMRRPTEFLFSEEESAEADITTERFGAIFCPPMSDKP